MKGLGAAAQVDGLDERTKKIEELWVQIDSKLEKVVQLARKLEESLGK